MLTKKQKLVAGALFEGKLSLVEIIGEYKLSTVVFEKWLGSKEFRGELERMGRIREMETEYTLQRFGSLAALKLAELMGSDKADTARRAAVEVIDRCLKRKEKEEERVLEEEMSEEKARRMVVVLAEGMGWKAKPRWIGTRKD